MNYKIIFFIIICLVSFTEVVFCQLKSKVIDPWEKVENHSRNSAIDKLPKFISSPVDLIFDELIRFYQHQISINSIQRCPYYISCSNYAKYAIQDYGSFVGLLYFVDRNYFRENIGMKKYYSIQKKGKYFKYDDSYYLYSFH